MRTASLPLGLPLVLPLVLLIACWPRSPGPAPLALAEGPVALVEEGTELGAALGAEERAAARQVALVVQVRAGSAHDPPGQEGLAWLTAKTMALGGAGERSAEQRRQALYALGTELEVQVGPELVRFGLRCAPEDALACAELLGEVLVAPSLDGPSLDRARAQALAELEQLSVGPPEALAHAAFERWTWQGHPYGHAQAGRTGSLPALSALDLQRFYAQRYLRPATSLGVAGRPDPRAVAALQQRLARLPAVLYRDVTPRLLPSARGRDLGLVTAPVDTACLVLGHATELGPGHPDRLAVEAGLAILGDGPRSRLGRALRLGAGADGELFAGLDPSMERVQPAFHLGLRAESAAAAVPMLAAALAELERLVAQGPDADELVLWQQVQARRESAQAATPLERVLSDGQRLLLGGPDRTTRTRAASALDPATVAAALKRHLHPQDLRIVVVAREVEPFGLLRTEGSPPPDVRGTETPAPPSPDYGIGIDEVSYLHASELLR